MQKNGACFVDQKIQKRGGRFGSRLTIEANTPSSKVRKSKTPEPNKRAIKNDRESKKSKQKSKFFQSTFKPRSRSRSPNPQSSTSDNPKTKNKLLHFFGKV